MKKQYLVSYRIQEGDIRTTAVDAFIGSSAKEALENILNAVDIEEYGCFKHQIVIISVNLLN